MTIKENKQGINTLITGSKRETNTNTNTRRESLTQGINKKKRDVINETEEWKMLIKRKGRK